MLFLCPIIIKDNSVSAMYAGGNRVEGNVNGVTVKFLVDSGALIGVMSI